MWANAVDEKRTGADMTAEGIGHSRRDAPERVIDTQDLFGGAREVLIRHNDAVYRLRITRFGKLILNK